MNRIIKTMMVCLCVSSLGYGQSGFNGAWVINDFKTPNGADKPSDIALRGGATRIMGVTSREEDVISVSEGTVNRDTITFKVTGPMGRRVNPYTGKLAGGS